RRFDEHEQLHLRGQSAGYVPPVISAVVASPNVLWPPDGKLRPVSVSVSVHDTCDLQSGLLNNFDHR
ncbi:MAG: hypothetical protein WB999_14820, partial [Candidatus Binataceae bacterium]